MNNLKCPSCGLVNRLDAFTCLRCKSALAQGAGAGSASAIPMNANVFELENSVHERPLWVAVGLWGLKTRAMAWAFVVLSIVVAIGWMYFSWTGVLIFLAALWYFLAIRWVDQHGSW
jgi:hypothetical protein